MPLFGEPLAVRHRQGARGTVWREGAEIHVAGRPEHLPRRLRDWLTARLRERLLPLVAEKAARIGRPVKRITVRDTRSRWGSCGPDGSLSFSWRLALAPPDVVDYLVAHEVAHLAHMNHGARFWALARDLCDGPIEKPQAWLKKHGEVLLQYGAMIAYPNRPGSQGAKADDSCSPSMRRAISRPVAVASVRPTCWWP